MPLSLLSPKALWNRKNGSSTFVSSPSLSSSTSSASVSPLPEAMVNQDRIGTGQIDKKNMQIPKINTKISTPISSEASSNYARSPTSPNIGNRVWSKDNSSVNSTSQRKLIYDRVRTTPSSLVRQSRVYSNDFDEHRSPSMNSMKSASFVRQNNKKLEDLPGELVPIVTLIDSQKLRLYASGKFHVPGVLDSREKIWCEVEAKLTGTELAIWRPSEDEFSIGFDGYGEGFKPTYINIADSRITLNNKEYEISLQQDDQYDKSLLMKFDTKDEYIKWITAIQLSNFEFVSLNEAFTAVMLSLKGPTFSDIHILLSPKKKFPRFEWCNMRLPQISSKWLKVYLVIMPADSKKKHRVEAYTSEKISKKNLILYIADVTNVFNVYPEQANMIDFNTIMKVSGEMFVNKNFEHLFLHDAGASTATTRTRSSSMKQIVNRTLTSSGSVSDVVNIPPPPKRTHHRSSSANSTSSFFNHAMSPTPEPKGSPKNVSTYFKKHYNEFATTSYLYLMPDPHPGVSGTEIMIRNFIHIVDTFGLYGRPNHFISDKTDMESLLFGLPSLPFFEYLSMDDAINLVESNITEAEVNSIDLTYWRDLFKSCIHKKIQKSGFRGSGDIKDLYGGIYLDYDVLSSPTLSIRQSGIPAAATENFVFDNFSDSGISPAGSERNISGMLGAPFTPEVIPVATGFE